MKRILLIIGIKRISMFSYRSNSRRKQYTLVGKVSNRAGAGSNERYIGKLDKHIEDTRSSSNYAIERFDILIISISTAALGFSLAFLKDIVKHGALVNKQLLLTIWILFGIAIVINLLSQKTSFYSCEYAIKISENKSRRARGKDEKWDEKKIKYWNLILNRTTIVFNFISLGTLIGGLVCVIIFAYQSI